jgi:hypothetical protein
MENCRVGDRRGAWKGRCPDCFDRSYRRFKHHSGRHVLVAVIVPHAMTLQEAKSIARHLGLTLRKVRSGDYRVNFRDGNETTAYYTDSLENAVDTAVEMARKRALDHHRTEPGDGVASQQPFKAE